MQIKTYDKSSLRIITDAIMEPKAKREYPLGFYLNERVLIAIGRWNRTPLLRVAGVAPKPSPRGYVHLCYCPNCGCEMWCTIVDMKQPAVTCRKCHSDEVLLFFGTPIAERASWTCTTLLSENYDPLITGDSTCEGKITREWVKHPDKFVAWLAPKIDNALRKYRYSGRPMWLVAHGKQWDRQARISREFNPAGAKVRIL